MNIRKPLGQATIAALLLAACSASFAAETKPRARPMQIKVIEQAIEAPASAIALPSGGVGLITLTPCAGCKPVSVMAGGRSRYVFNGNEVTADVMRRALAANPQSAAVLLYRKNGNELTRLMVFGR